MKKVMIVGAGFAGFEAAKKLKNQKDIEVTLIDQKNYHLFQPLLYQVATAGLNAGDISTSLRGYFRGSKNIKVLLGKAENFNFQNQSLSVSGKTFNYDYLIIALGAETNYFGNDSWAKHTYELKSVEDAFLIRNDLLKLLEEKEFEGDENLKIAVIGGGPTGVELAGSIGEFLNFTTQSEFRSINPKNTKLILFEGSDQILSQFSKKLSLKAEKSLKKLGVTISKNTIVENIEKNAVCYEGKNHHFDMIIWAAGVKAKSINSRSDLTTGKAGGVFVDDDLSLKEFKNVFVLGDQSRSNTKNFPGVAPLATQQGRHAAKNILRDLKNKKREEFNYVDKGSLAVIGRKAAVGKIAGFEFSGFIAWFLWCFIHIVPLISFRNRFLVLFEFIWSYYNYKKGVRIITSVDEKVDNKPEAALKKT